MPRTVPNRRMPRHHPMLHRPPHHRAHGAKARPVRICDLVLALLGVALLDGLTLAAAFTLAAGTTAP
ncbi:hypothetical protein [Methylobacterium sp. AMS5]|uniref:hypothetical protein n=1 Tax=Methylobacterium sp. AMS5 TaxID=925818 RepID=UPI00074F82DF|nr:hypothetical protein [Methylobacterium sp. AMS5]AMB46690.1 hypothetical protein Y590_17285 [Methylobacterium sp. AMS5]